MEKKNCIRVSILISFIFLTVVICAYSVSAFTLDINPDDNSVNIGDNITLNASMNIESGERVPINHFRLDIQDEECRFEVNGTKISGCSNFNIIPTINSNLGNGTLTWNFNVTSYIDCNGSGYESGLLNYIITINSSSLESGISETIFGVNVAGANFNNNTNIIIIKPIEIINQSINDSCILMNDSFNVRSFINGSIDEVFINFKLNGNEQNISLGNHGEGFYSYTFNNSKINETGLLEWKFIARDIGGNIIEGTLNQDYIHDRTLLTVSYPADGPNNWYITRPVFNLSNSDANCKLINYAWNGNLFLYSGPFQLEGLPNSGNETGGIHVLRYWICDQKKHNQTFKFDFTDPKIIPVFPIENQTVNTQNVNIQIELDEIYQSNSGINKSTVKILLDNNPVNANVNNSGSVDAVATYLANNLSEVLHTLFINASDNAGRISSKTWNFSILLTNTSGPFNLTVHSPSSGLVLSNRINLNITVSKEIANITYINYNDRRPRMSKLCEDCSEYGKNQKKTKILHEGINNISIAATDEFGNIAKENLLIIVDSKKPVIKSTSPLRGFATGNFSVVFFDENPNSLILYAANDTMSRVFPVNISNCVKNKYYECKIMVNLGEFNGGQVRYNFNLTDITNKSTLSRTRLITIDETPPQITLLDYEIERRNRVKFMIEVIEDNFDKIAYIDMSEVKQKERTLCTRLNEDDRCEVWKTFNEGEHNLTLIVYDKAGNTDTGNVYFSIEP